MNRSRETGHEQKWSDWKIERSKEIEAQREVE